jgi:hypothetical protein
VFAIMVIALLVWTVLYAPVLERAAETSTEGARQAASLAFLRPIAALSRAVGVSAVAESAAIALGRQEGPAAVGLVAPPQEIPTISPDPGPAPVKPTKPGKKPANNGGSPTPDPAAPIRVPTPSKRLRVVVVGDSLAAGLGYFAPRVFEPRLVRVLRQGQISTGLARPDYFNWPRQMREIVDAFDPDLVIVLIGKNDNQDLRTWDGRTETNIGTFDWPLGYRERVDAFIDIATERGAKVAWVGLPISRETKRWPLLRRQNDIFEAAAASRPNVSFFDSWEAFDARDSGYTPYRWVNGEITLVRETDGLHFTAEGYTQLARAVAEMAAEDFGLSTKTLSP